MDSSLDVPAMWHISLHRQIPGVIPQKAILWRGHDVNVLDVSAAELTSPFPVRFDTFIDNINQLSGGYAEGDGSFGLVGPEGQWKICGNIYEYQDRSQYVELQGCCPDAIWETFVAQLGVRTEDCVVQHMQGGFFQSLEQFLASQW